MTQQAPKVSVIIAAYRPGEAVHRVIDSLDAQTLPQDEFEVIFVDDGSPDDTYARLQGFAATRPNMQVYRIENSGWPSRPRNVGIGHARGEYVLFMDHDDSLFPDGLRRAYEYAKLNGADVLSPKESKTNDVWWGMSSLTDGNIPNALTEQGIHRMLPMVPHKLYRRQMLLDHYIRFPEGSRVLWEDWFINLDAFRHAKVISVMAEYPMYLWHASDFNSSHTFSPSRLDFWDRLEDMMQYIADVLAGPSLADARSWVMAHQIRTRVIDRCLRLVFKEGADLKIKHMALGRARKLIARFTSDAVYRQIPKKHQAQLYLIRAGEMELMKAFHAADLALTANVTATSTRWSDGLIEFDAQARWEPKKPDEPGFRQIGDKVVRAVDGALERALPPEILDMTGDPSELVVDLAFRARYEYVTWAVPFVAHDAMFAPNKAGALSLLQNGRSEVDLSTAALGQPLDDTVWDVRMRTEWVGMERKGPLLYRGQVLPAVLRGRARVAYSNASKGLSLDLAQRLRTLAIDAKPRSGNAGPITGFSAPLDNVTTFGETTLDASMVVAIPDDAVPANLDDEQAVEVLEKLAAEGELGAARVVANTDGARFEGGAALPAGRYTLYARREGKLHATKRSITVDDVGQAQFD